MPAPGVCLNIVSERNLKDGQGSPNNPEKFLDQDFHQLKQFCLKGRLRFVDNLFLPEMKSIGLGPLKRGDLRRVVWKRPHELVPNPVYIVQGASRFDFIQGRLGNCWFLASVGALTFQKPIMKQVINDEQSFSVDYAGIFHFKFWRFGSWLDVVIDDKLPTIDGRLVFVQSKTPNEFWPALLEKAYAKVCGSYADMDAGSISEALMDFTGGPHMTIKLSDASGKLWETMRRASQSESLMGCGTPGGQAGLLQNNVLPSGLVEMHAYTVTGVAEVVCKGRPVKLVRIFNPWGHGEWNRDWSDRSPLWKLVRPEDQKYKVVLDNGEFWMSMEDFCRNFSDLDICCSDVNVLTGSHSSSWKTEVHRGQWVLGTTAGGCSDDIDSFSRNPQFHVTLKEPVEGPRDESSPNLLVSLIQKSHKRNRHLATNFHIGFNIYEVPAHLKDQREKFPASFFRNARLVGKNESYINTREIMEFFRFKAGEYLIVPSTYKPNEAASFLLTVYSKTEAIIKDSSGYGMTRKKMIPRDNDESFQLFPQYADKYGEVDAERLQRLLNENLYAGHSQKKTGFSLDLCKSLVALMDVSSNIRLSVTGRLSEFECLRLWKRAVFLKDIFYGKDVSRTGSLSLNELRNALTITGFVLSDSMLNLMALRYGDSNGEITLENFIVLVLRMDCMAKTFKRLSAGGPNMMLGENEWMHLTMYS
ncbi:calpain-14-like isoform X1 [Cyprinus carpio]|uniref:Calpain-14-like isoform X1 n=1 Tax=Cyprinus carpio TaxID=7962 RepID=A0A9Q9XCF4_CYPCA|nr:calpain-14-like isoform X1 [Cyprinus carpio]